ncbi:MAG: ankyrin repeat domain-containing protein, partial [bacterium]
QICCLVKNNLQKGCYTTIKAVIKSSNIHNTDEKGMSAIMYAAANNNIGVVSQLLETNLTSNEAQYILNWAAVNNYNEIVDIVLARGADINQRDSAGKSALIYAAENNHPNIALKLLEKSQFSPNEAEHILNWAIVNDYDEIIKAVIKNSKINNIGAIMYAAANNHKGINEQDSNGATALILAAQNGHLDTVKALLQNQNVDVNKHTKDGATALIFAAQNGYLDIVNTLLKNQKVEIDKPANNGATALILAASNNHPDIVEALLQNSRTVTINKQNINGTTALMYAAQKGYLDIVNTLLKNQKVEIDKPANNGATALILAALNGHLDIVNALLKNQNVDIDKQANDGATALIVAAQNGHLDIVNTLLENGADPHKKNKNGKTALELSIESNHLDVAKTILDLASSKEFKISTFIKHPFITIGNLLGISYKKEKQMLKDKEQLSSANKNKIGPTDNHDSKTYNATLNRLLNSTPDSVVIIKSNIKNDDAKQQKVAPTPKQKNHSTTLKI